MAATKGGAGEPSSRGGKGRRRRDFERKARWLLGGCRSARREATTVGSQRGSGSRDGQEAAPPTSALLGAAEGSPGPYSLGSTDDYPTDTSSTSSASDLTPADGPGSDSSGPAELRATVSGGASSSIARVLLAHDVRPGECLLQTFVGYTPGHRWRSRECECMAAALASAPAQRLQPRPCTSQEGPAGWWIAATSLRDAEQCGAAKWVAT